ncbi:MAG: endonuclease III [Candidatus Aenigmarchaeota archaeon]|nr:endonuclease III [Candidatus Aenigmarchaeota archaeon]
MTAEEIIITLRKHYGTRPRNWHTKQGPFRVLVSTVLSQRTRDENTDRAAMALFAKYGTAKKLAAASVKNIERLIKPAGFYRQKAPRIKQIAEIIHKNYNGKITTKMDELLELPGVGRKTAGCVLVYGHGIPAIPVDTHVHRVSNMLGIVKTQTPEQTEYALMKIIPKKHWLLLNQLFVIHGQNICSPIGPRCSACPVNKYCKYYKDIYLSPQKYQT